MFNFILLLLIVALTLVATKYRIIKLLVSSVILVLYGFWTVSDLFTGRGVTESVYYHLAVSNKGVSVDELSGKIIVAIIFILVIFLLFMFEIVSRKKGWTLYKIKSENILYFLIAIISLASPSMINIYKSLEYFSYDDGSVVAKDYYVPESLSEARKYNYVFIYAESLERTFRNVDGVNYLPGLSKIANNYIEFSNIRQLPGMGWTMAGIVNTQCAIPFVLAQGNGGGNFENFLPNATCIGDVLKKEGYTTEFIRGSAKEFAGGDKFLSQHGWVNQHDKQFFVDNGLASEQQISGWGIHDDAMLKHAWSEFTKLSEKKEPFILSFLTVNTHPPSGLVLEECNGVISSDITNPMLRSVACSDYLLSNFINKIQQSEYFDNTIIILVSDHLIMQSDASPYLAKNDMERRNNFIIIKKDLHPQVNDTEGSLIDVWPTILDVAEVKSSKLGFGRSLLSTSGKDTNLAQYLSKNGSISNYLGFAGSLWDFPNINEDMTFQDDKYIIGKRSYKLPLYAKVEPDGTFSSIWFDAFAKSSADSSNNAKRIFYAERCDILNPQLKGVCAYLISKNETIRININGQNVTRDVLSRRTKLFRNEVVGVSANAYYQETGVSNYTSGVKRGISFLSLENDKVKDVINFDTCDGEKVDSNKLSKFINANNQNQIIFMSNDSLNCGSEVAMKSIVDVLGEPKFSNIQYRQQVIGLYGKDKNIGMLVGEPGRGLDAFYDVKRNVLYSICDALPCN